VSLCRIQQNGAVCEERTHLAVRDGLDTSGIASNAGELGLHLELGAPLGKPLLSGGSGDNRERLLSEHLERHAPVVRTERLWFAGQDILESRRGNGAVHGAARTSATPTGAVER